MMRRPALERWLQGQERRLRRERQRAELRAAAEEADEDESEPVVPETSVQTTDVEPQIGAPAQEREAEPPAAEQTSDQPPPETTPAHELEPAGPPALEPGMPTELTPQQAFWEENCRWRRRGPDDYDWDDDEEDGKRILPECIYRYDPLELDDDYDPLEDA
jgi:hypothetical protein